MSRLDSVELNPKAPRLSVEYAKAREAVKEEEHLSRRAKRDALLLAIDVLHGQIVHKNGHTIVVFNDTSEARF